MVSLFVVCVEKRRWDAELNYLTELLQVISKQSNLDLHFESLKNSDAMAA